VKTPIDEELIAQLALNRVPGIGSLTYTNLLQYFGTATDVFSAKRQQLLRVPDINQKLVEHLASGIDAMNVEQDILWLEEDPQHQAITLSHADYPALLAQIHRPPPVLFLKGNASLLHTVQLAIVGSRNPTPAGIENARAFARNLAATGLTITSGLATGIDGAAHQGALDAKATVNGMIQKGRTIAVAATGLNRIYPSRHRDLAYDIADNGLLVSEFPVGMGPLKENFPRRNRLISGLSLGTLVIEAAIKSGSLITARFAMEQGREVFAIPGSIHSPQSRGCHWLIRQGAKLVETAEDIAEEILPILPSCHAGEERMNHNEVTSHLSMTEKVLLEAIGFEPVNLDTLLTRTGMMIDELSVTLSQLELHGLIDILPGGMYSRSVKTDNQ
jgi:DNA processing protein